ncbi:MAG: endonuclease/exonuclease/phosphatase family protein [Hyphomonadaceae bacterium]
MKRLLITLAAIVALLAAYGGVFYVLNSSSVAAAQDVRTNLNPSPSASGRTLEIMTWNLGYGGLGAGSDFVADGGESTFPPSRTAVRENVAGIARTLESRVDATNVFLFQEIARGGPINYWVDLKRSVDRTLAGNHWLFNPDFLTRFMPWPLRMEHGTAIYTGGEIADFGVVPLPAQSARIMGVTRRYAALYARMPISEAEGGGGWTVVSLHLAAFDENATVRTRQLRELLAWAQTEYEAGRHVVLGGDFNLILAETDFPHTTEERFLFWVFPFPQDALPDGWRIVTDPTTPSVRTNERPYVAGENYTANIDGFIISPNVTLESVEGVDLGFRHADHQPVVARFRAAP